MSKKFNLIAGFLIGIILIIFFGFLTRNFLPNISDNSLIIINRLKDLKRIEVLQADLFSYKTFENSSFLYLNVNQFIVIETGQAIYGLDLSKDFKVIKSGKNIEIMLPNIELLNLSVNPDSIDFIGLKKGMFTSQDHFEALKKEVSVELYSQLKIKARNKQLLDQAEKNARQIIYSMFKSLGYENININFRKHSH